MRRLILAAALIAAPALAQPDGQEEVSILPEGPGQEEVFFGCSACHNTAVIRRSRLSREQWDGLMDWMVEKHGMTPLEPAERQVIVDYLARHFGPAAQQQRPGWRNPFLN